MPTPARSATAESVTSSFEEVNSFNAAVSRRSRFLCASARGERAISDSDKVASCKTEGPPYITLEAENPPFLQYSIPEDKIPCANPFLTRSGSSPVHPKVLDMSGRKPRSRARSRGRRGPQHRLARCAEGEIRRPAPASRTRRRQQGRGRCHSGASAQAVRAHRCRDQSSKRP